MTKWYEDPAVCEVDARRGHSLRPDIELPKLYETERVPAPEKLVVAHYFAGVCDWWIVEADIEDGRAFGYACLGDPASAEWGYVDLGELARVEARVPLRVAAVSATGYEWRPAVWTKIVVERDLYWTPTTFEAVRRARFE